MIKNIARFVKNRSIFFNCGVNYNASYGRFISGEIRY